MPTDFAYRYRLSVRFRDCDAMGHVNHAVYFTYLEQCRLTFWREVTGAPSPHTRVIVARAECDYRAPAHFGDELEVGLRVGEIGRSSFVLKYEIVHVAGGHLIATGTTVMVSYDAAAGKSVPLPEASRILLESLKSGSEGVPDRGQAGDRPRVRPPADPLQ
jgi:acyl-CoA thioester hydrolase